MARILVIEDESDIRQVLDYNLKSAGHEVIEAARGMGFSQFEILRYVQIPLALRSSLPAIVNGLISLVKSTTVGNAIAVSEITYASIMVWTQRDNVVEMMIVLLAFFSMINFVIARIGQWVERRLAVPGFGL